MRVQWLQAAASLSKDGHTGALRLLAERGLGWVFSKVEQLLQE